MSLERLDHIVAGAIFDFAGFLTTRDERITLSAKDNASPAADAVKAFLELRGVNEKCEPFFPVAGALRWWRVIGRCDGSGDPFKRDAR